MLDSETGEIVEHRLEHPEAAREFYAGLAGRARVGMEATGHAHWFERVLREYGHELWVGNAAAIRASVVRKQKTDARDALHILDLLVSDRFPPWIWMASVEERDARQLLRHRE
jgi:transposase